MAEVTREKDMKLYNIESKISVDIDFGGEAITYEEVPGIWFYDGEKRNPPPIAYEEAIVDYSPDDIRSRYAETAIDELFTRAYSGK